MSAAITGTSVAPHDLTGDDVDAVDADAGAGSDAAERRPRGFAAFLEHAGNPAHDLGLGRWASSCPRRSRCSSRKTFFTGLRVGAFVPLLASLVVSLPLYVCATASVPIAAALVGAGMPGGAALVFLMAGPAAGVATIGAISRVLGRRTLIVYLTTIIVGSVLAGLLFDSLLSAEAVGHAGITNTPLGGPSPAPSCCWC